MPPRVLGRCTVFQGLEQASCTVGQSSASMVSYAMWGLGQHDDRHQLFGRGGRNAIGLASAEEQAIRRVACDLPQKLVAVRCLRPAF